MRQRSPVYGAARQAWRCYDERECDTHFLSIGAVTRNETQIAGEKCGFIGEFEGFSKAGLERTPCGGFRLSMGRYSQWIREHQCS